MKEKSRLVRVVALAALVLALAVVSTGTMAQQPEGGEIESIACGDNISCSRSGWAARISNSGGGGVFLAEQDAYSVGIKGSGRPGVYGSSGAGIGVKGTSTNGAAIWGRSTHAAGVYGRSDNSTGVYGTAASSTGYGGYFENTANGTALYAVGEIGASGTGIIESVNTYDGPFCPIWPLEPPSSGRFVTEGDCGAGIVAKGPLGVYGVSTTGGAGVRGYGGSMGVYGETYDGSGVYGKAEAASGDRYGVEGEVQGDGFGLFTLDDLYVGGACTGCTMALVGRNAGAEVLRIGDVVAVSGVGPILKGHASPILEVRQAMTTDMSILGVVYRKGELYAAGAEGEDHDSVQPVAGDASPGDYLFIATSGLAQVRVAQELGAPAPGQALTVSETAGVATVAGADANPALVFGTAMQAESDENSLIWAMISTR